MMSSLTQNVLTLLILAAILINVRSASPTRNVTKVLKQGGKKVYAHVMPWFETKESSGNGQWGIHWTMTTRNPDYVDGTGRREIAAYYYPDINLYPSGAEGLIDYQIQQMKYAGIDGVLMDWPGTAQAFDYPKNAQNAHNFIQKLEAAGLEYAIVYEDHNLRLAQEGGFITDVLEQGREDMEFLRDNYFGRSNYLRINDAPLLMTFGPQTLMEGSQWDVIFEGINPKPTFLTLWYQSHQGGSSCRGEYPWIYLDFMDGLNNFYNNRLLETKFGVVYPGFKGYYGEGGWAGPDWAIEPVGPETFRRTVDAAWNSDVEWVQVATWNDYGESTVIEPTREFGNAYLNILQEKQKVPYGNRELNLIKALYLKRQHYATLGRADVMEKLVEVNDALNDLRPDLAEKLLKAF